MSGYSHRVLRTLSQVLGPLLSGVSLVLSEREPCRILTWPGYGPPSSCAALLHILLHPFQDSMSRARVPAPFQTQPIRILLVIYQLHVAVTYVGSCPHGILLSLRNVPNTPHNLIAPDSAKGPEFKAPKPRRHRKHPSQQSQELN